MKRWSPWLRERVPPRCERLFVSFAFLRVGLSGSFRTPSVGLRSERPAFARWRPGQLPVAPGRITYPGHNVGAGVGDNYPSLGRVPESSRGVLRPCGSEARPSGSGPVHATARRSKQRYTRGDRGSGRGRGAQNPAGAYSGRASDYGVRRLCHDFGGDIAATAHVGVSSAPGMSVGHPRQTSLDRQGGVSSTRLDSRCWNA
jgi:hypothetical protein